MITIDLIALAALIRPEEGCVLGTYSDHGNIATGYGHKLLQGEAPCRSIRDAEHYLMADLERCRKEVAQIASDQPESVQKAIICMDYQLGLTRLMKFKRMLNAIRAHDYSAAGHEAVDSSWGRLYPRRLSIVLRLMRNA